MEIYPHCGMFEVLMLVLFILLTNVNAALLFMWMFIWVINISVFCTMSKSDIRYIFKSLTSVNNRVSFLSYMCAVSVLGPAFVTCRQPF
jgi:hypothetical protein